MCVCDVCVCVWGGGGGGGGDKLSCTKYRIDCPYLLASSSDSPVENKTVESLSHDSLCIGGD